MILISDLFRIADPTYMNIMDELLENEFNYLIYLS